MRFTVLAVILFLVGCTAQTSGGQLDRATIFCSDKKGVDYLVHVMSTTVVCRNGESQRI